MLVTETPPKTPVRAAPQKTKGAVGTKTTGGRATARKPAVEKAKVPDLLQGVPVPAPRKPKRSEPEGQFALMNTHILGLPLFDPTAHKKRDRNRVLKTTIATRVPGEDGQFRRQENLIKIICAFRLGADDLECLLALAYLAARSGAKINAQVSPGHRRDVVETLGTSDVPPESSDIDDIAKINLDPPSDDNVFLQCDHMRFNVTWYELCREMGLSHGSSTYEAITSRMERLRVVTYFDYGPVGGNARRVKAAAKQDLVNFRIDDTNEQQIVIVLNAALSRAVLGNSFAKVPLSQYRELESNTARILFTRLCAMIRFNGSLSINVETLVDWVYFDKDGGKSTHSQRKRMIRDALDAIGRLTGWRVDWINPRLGKCEIYRGTDPHPGRQFQCELDLQK